MTGPTLGPAHAARLAATEAAKYVPLRPIEQVQAALWKTWTRQADLTGARRRWVRQRQNLVHGLNGMRGTIAQRFADVVRERHDQLAVVVRKIDQIDSHLSDLEKRVGVLAADPAVAVQPGDYLTTQRKAWAVDRQERQAEAEHATAMQEAALATTPGSRDGRPRGLRRPDPVEPYSPPGSDRGGYGIGR